MKNKILYRLTDLGYRYAEAAAPALEVARLELFEGECVLVTGSNGSGKTTFLKILNDLIAPRCVLSGRMEFRGEMIRNELGAGKSQILRKATVYLHQHPYILAGSIGANMAFACKARKIPPRLAEEKSRAALEIVGLAGLPTDHSRGLSGGESQRLALARAIAVGTDVLLLDEPTASADANSSLLITKALKTLVDAGTTVIFASHDTELLESLAERVIEFRNGRIVDDRRRSVRR